MSIQYVRTRVSTAVGSDGRAHLLRSLWSRSGRLWTVCGTTMKLRRPTLADEGLPLCQFCAERETLN